MVGTPFLASLLESYKWTSEELAACGAAARVFITEKNPTDHEIGIWLNGYLAGKFSTEDWAPPAHQEDEQ